jgi:hypothetical protein
VRSALIPAIVGVLSGALGAVCVGRFSVAAPTPPARSEPPLAMPILPPGWDARYLARSGSVESKVVEPPKPSSPAAQPGAHETPSEHERGRAEHYQRELETQANAIAEHEREPVDESWSQGAAQSVRQAIADAAADSPFAVRAVDCRSKTCVASVTFPSPAEALGRHRALGAVSPPVCHGMSSVLDPPTGDGPYDATVVYYCR